MVLKFDVLVLSPIKTLQMEVVDIKSFIRCVI